MSADTPQPHRWPSEAAQAWLNRCADTRGCNYIPMNCANTTAFWQELDAPLIDRELRWAEDTGLNSHRVFVQYLIYEADPQGLIDRFSRFLDIAARHGMKVMPVLLDDFWGPEPVLGRQPDPVPGVHNSQWTASPGLSMAQPDHWPALADYVQSLTSRLAQDERIIAWDLFNAANPERRLLGAAAFSWAREVRPSQPLVACREAEDLQDLARFTATSIQQVMGLLKRSPMQLRQDVQRCARSVWRAATEAASKSLSRSSRNTRSSGTSGGWLREQRRLVSPGAGPRRARTAFVVSRSALPGRRSLR